MGRPPGELAGLPPSVEDSRGLEALPLEFEPALIESVTAIEGMIDEVFPDERSLGCTVDGAGLGEVEPSPVGFVESVEESPPWPAPCCAASEPFPAVLPEEGTGGGLLTGPIGGPLADVPSPDFSAPLPEPSEAWGSPVWPDWCGSPDCPV